MAAHSLFVPPDDAERYRRHVTRLFGFLAWAQVCLLLRQVSRDEPHALVYYPLVLTAFGSAWDNIRLLRGVTSGRAGASKFMSHVSFFLHMVALPTLLASYSHVIAAMTGAGWMEKVGAILAVPMCMSGLNTYVSQVHGQLVYTEKDGVPRYTMDKSLISNSSRVLLPVMLVMGGGLAVGAVCWWNTGDSVPFYLQLVTLAGQTSWMQIIPPRYKYGFTNSLELLFIAGLMRVQRYY